MTTPNQGQQAPFSSVDEYNAAVQFYIQEFRTLGERTNAFLIVQSILVSAFVLVLIMEESHPYAFEFIVLGISVVGILYCFLHHRAGQSGSRTAFGWRQYMCHIENNEQNAPWNWLYAHIHDSEKWLLKKHPLPSVWLFSPAIFLAVWLCASLYIPIRLIFDSSYHLTICCFPLVLSLSIIATLFALGALGFVIWRIKIWRCSREDRS